MYYFIEINMELWMVSSLELKKCVKLQETQLLDNATHKFDLEPNSGFT